MTHNAPNQTDWCNLSSSLFNSNVASWLLYSSIRFRLSLLHAPELEHKQKYLKSKLMDMLHAETEAPKIWRTSD